MIIEKGKIADVDELEALYDSLNDYLAESTNYPGWLKHVYPVRETAVQGVESDSLFIAKIGSSIAGSIILNHEPEKAYYQAKWGIEADYKDCLVVRTLVVHPSFMNQHIASTLLNFAKQYAIAQQVKSIRLDVSVKNTPAIALYEKLGYSYIATVDLGLPYDHLKWFNLYELVL